ncbi:GNAT family N-acetyltransferase [Mycolicibacterium sp. 018/SC-01/001]|uniref:GNAT family N-acetyltransferase n=1 Tax=Mycolicibacterium sp. 018/SC-01/001 TaxID=2592069 RepID=UPI0011815B3C|nr:GNAT family N-acetyltransferase [Mycolicibacterium sp. 018/SC-01/001]TRW87962.1 GNAT family N-acetyltransferase [Mycolicibacterium sp. 018/SC-01/001]
MHCRAHDVESFVALAVPLYERDPVAHTVELTALSAGVAPEALLLAVHDGPAVVAAAMQTPPYPLLVNGLSDETIDPAVEFVAATRPGLSGVRGRPDLAQRFAAGWQSRHGGDQRVTVEELLYRLGTLTHPVGVPGTSRLATEADRGVLAKRVEDFFVEAFRETRDEEAGLRFVADSLAVGNRFVLWTLDDDPVSMAMLRAPASGVSRIGPVHTPPVSRGRGFGSAVTAAAAQLARDEGVPEVVLFADLANPVSNAIYRRIGFEPVRENVRIDFVTAGVGAV